MLWSVILAVTMAILLCLPWLAYVVAKAASFGALKGKEAYRRQQRGQKQRRAIYKIYRRVPPGNH